MTIIDTLRHAHEELRRAVTHKRRIARKEDGPLATAFREAMALWDDMKANGGTLADLAGGLERIFRDHWPKGECACPRCRWSCPYCEDTGAICEQRPAHIYGGALVTVVVPCRCPNGRRFMPKSRGGEDFTAAGKTAKAGMSRVGR